MIARVCQRRRRRCEGVRYGAGYAPGPRPAVRAVVAAGRGDRGLVRFVFLPRYSFYEPAAYLRSRGGRGLGRQIERPEGELRQDSEIRKQARLAGAGERGEGVLGGVPAPERHLRESGTEPQAWVRMPQRHVRLDGPGGIRPSS